MSFSCHQVCVTYGARPVLRRLDLQVSTGTRIGLIGENGSGKSTLLRVLAGRRQPDSGTVQVPDDVGYFAQDTGIDPAAGVGQVLHDALAPLHRAVSRLESLAGRLGDEPDVTDEYAQLLEWVIEHDAWDADRRATVAAHRLGLAGVQRDRPAGELSGGERARLALAAVLTRRPSTLLLDEPTNHLDADALDFLQQQLVSMAGTVLVASHDRVFLDAVCTGIVDLDPSHFGTDGQGGRSFTGSFTAYRAEQRAARRRWQLKFDEQQTQLAGLRAMARTTDGDIAGGRPPRDNDKFIHAFKGARVQAVVSRRRRNAEQRIETLERARIPKPPQPLRFRGSFDREPIASVGLRDIEVGGRVHCARLDVAPGEKMLLTGPNGAGKSSLLQVVAGTLEPDTGTRQVRARRIGTLAQEVRIDRADLSALELYQRLRPPTPLRELGLLRPRDETRPVAELSLGTQRRVELALLMAAAPDLVLLDEPTNHLSPTLIEELEEAVASTAVTVLVASHDRWLRGRWVGSELELGPH